MKIFESHVNAQQRVPLSEEDDSNNIVDMMTHSMDSSQCFPLPPIITQWAHGCSGHVDRDGRYHGPNNMDLCSKRPICLWLLLSDHLPAIEANTDSHMASFPRVFSQQAGGNLIPLDSITAEVVFHSFLF